MIERKAKSRNSAYTIDDMIAKLEKAREVHGGETRLVIMDGGTCIGKPLHMQSGFATNAKFGGEYLWRNDDQHTPISHGWSWDVSVEEQKYTKVLESIKLYDPDAEVCLVLF